MERWRGEEKGTGAQRENGRENEEANPKQVASLFLYFSSPKMRRKLDFFSHVYMCMYLFFPRELEILKTCHESSWMAFVQGAINRQNKWRQTSRSHEQISTTTQKLPIGQRTGGMSVFKNFARLAKKSGNIQQVVKKMRTSGEHRLSSRVYYAFGERRRRESLLMMMMAKEAVLDATRTNNTI